MTEFEIRNLQAEEEEAPVEEVGIECDDDYCPPTLDPLPDLEGIS